MIKPSDFKSWRNLTVDVGLDDSWLERLNALPDIRILGTCSGHADANSWVGRWPQVWFEVPAGRIALADKIIGRLARIGGILFRAYPEKRRHGTTIYAYHSINGPPECEEEVTRKWWEDVIAALESIQGTCR